MLSSLSLICDRYLVSELALLSLPSFTPDPLDSLFPNKSGLIPPSRNVLKTPWALDLTSRISRREVISDSWIFFSRSAGLVLSADPLAAPEDAIVVEPAKEKIKS